MANKKIVRILTLMSVMFMSLILYLTFIELFERDKLASSPYNQRQWDDEHGTVRGSIYDANGVVLASTENGIRQYPYGPMYVHIIGYNSRTYGRINIESTYNNELLGKNDFGSIIGTISSDYGYNVNLTIDHNMQKYAYNLLGNNNGSIVALNPKTGEIIAMVSKPDFDPNDDELEKNWNKLAERVDAPFVSRATSGLYAPGSTFKIITSIGAIRNGLSDAVFEDNGFVKIGKAEFENQKRRAYGNINIKRGFAVSSNVVFCTIADRIGGGKLCNIASDFGFNKRFDFDLPYNISVFPENVADSEKEAALGIGQGDILATPLQMAMVTSAIANNGVMMKPYLIKSITDMSGNRIKATRPAKLYNCISDYEADFVKNMMIEAVRDGTGANASIYGIDVAGKTGTSENELTNTNDGKEHIWFVGFAPADDPQIAVCVMMEYSGGTGGGGCAPVARNIMQKYLFK